MSNKYLMNKQEEQLFSSYLQEVEKTVFPWVKNKLEEDNPPKTKSLFNKKPRQKAKQ